MELFVDVVKVRYVLISADSDSTSNQYMVNECSNIIQALNAKVPHGVDTVPLSDEVASLCCILRFRPEDFVLDLRTFIDHAETKAQITGSDTLT